MTDTMRATRVFDTIDTHTAGEPTRLITSGLPCGTLSGSVAEQRDQFATEYDDVRRLLIKEPRGHQNMFGAVLVEPSTHNADLGLFFMDSKGYLDMCGHGTIGAITALVETGKLEYETESASLLVETPAGLVSTKPIIDERSVEKVIIRDIEAFYHDATEITIAQVGTIPVDIVYAGNFFAMVNADDIGIDVSEENAENFVSLGLEIRRAVNETVSIHNPLTDRPGRVKLTEFYEEDGEVNKNITVFGTGQIDRSPCGTGTCAKMALLREKGELDVDEPFIHESIIGTRFEGTIVESQTKHGAVIDNAQVAGSAYIMAKNTFFVDPDDPIQGFTLGEPRGE